MERSYQVKHHLLYLLKFRIPSWLINQQNANQLQGGLMSGGLMTLFLCLFGMEGLKWCIWLAKKVKLNGN